MIQRARNTRKLSKTQRLPKHAMTYYGLQKWHNAMFEKLGWMVLAKAKGYNDKITQYKHSIQDLIDSIKHVMGEYENHNRKHDLVVLLMNVQVLKEHVAKDFK